MRLVLGLVPCVDKTFEARGHIADRLAIISVALHLQSRPRRTVSLLQYLRGYEDERNRLPVPLDLLDPSGHNAGEYIVTIPDGLFHVIRLMRLQKGTEVINMLNLLVK